MLKETQIIAESVLQARDLVNTPPSDKAPAAIARQVAGLARKIKGLSARVYTKREIEKMKMGGLLGVNRGSVNPPAFLHLKYRPTRAKKRIVLVGKGITFDSGGLSLKPPKSMEDMKCDMSGSVAAAFTVLAAARLKLPLEIHGLCAYTENLPGGDALKPGDVLKAMNGKTIEVLNTDAEGRLILADALTYGSRLKPDVMIDFATLTGACVVALGMNITALMGSSAELIEALKQAGEKSGEPMWELPLPEMYRKQLKSRIADLKNIGNPGQAGTITAGLFLSEFVDVKNWVHCDIAGTAFLDSEEGIHPAGGTGTPIRSLVTYLQNL